MDFINFFPKICFAIFLIFIIFGDNFKFWHKILFYQTIYYISKSTRGLLWLI